MPKLQPFNFVRKSGCNSSLKLIESGRQLGSAGRCVISGGAMSTNNNFPRRRNATPENIRKIALMKINLGQGWLRPSRTQTRGIIMVIIIFLLEFFWSAFVACLQNPFTTLFTGPVKALNWSSFSSSQIISCPDLSRMFSTKDMVASLMTTAVFCGNPAARF